MALQPWNSGSDLTTNGLLLSKVGTVPIVLHRAIEGKIKTCTVLKSSTGKGSSRNAPSLVQG